MELDPTTSAILALVGGALSAGGLATKLVDWLSKRTSKKATIDAKSIDADLTVNERLLRRIDELEKRDDANDVAHAAELRALNAQLSAVGAERDRLARRELDLIGQLAASSRELETTREDLIAQRRHAERLEGENRKLRDGTGRVRRPT